MPLSECIGHAPISPEFSVPILLLVRSGRNVDGTWPSLHDIAAIKSLKMQLIVTTVLMVPVTWLLANAFLPET